MIVVFFSLIVPLLFPPSFFIGCRFFLQFLCRNVREPKGAYYDKKIYENDPFAKLDQVGVGKLVKMAAKLGRETRPDLKLGICGEHGGDPSSVEFCHNVGLDYVSCSPYRVPIARLAAAQAAIKNPRA